MHPKLSKQVNRSNQNFQYYSGILKDLNKDQLNFKHDPDRWSIAQTVYHLFLSETMIHKSVLKFSFEIKNQKLGMGAGFRSFLTNVGLASNMKFKAPTTQLETFPERIDPEVVLEKWVSSRDAFMEYVHHFNEEKLSYRIFKHPLAGSFTLSQTMGFMNYHMAHHQRQIERIMKSESFPK